MTMLRIDPFRGFDSLTKKMENIAREFEQGVRVESGKFNPYIDVIEDSQRFRVFAELPGMTKEILKISVNEENILTIKGEKKKEDVGEKNTIRSERIYGEFTRSFNLPENIDSANIEAKFENGVLELKLPKIEPPQPKVIEVAIN